MDYQSIVKGDQPIEGFIATTGKAGFNNRQRLLKKLFASLNGVYLPEACPGLAPKYETHIFLCVFNEPSKKNWFYYCNNLLKN